MPASWRLDADRNALVRHSKHFFNGSAGRFYSNPELALEKTGFRVVRHAPDRSGS